MQTRPSEVWDNEELDSDRVIVVGDPRLSSQHIRAWKLAGADAQRASTDKKALADLKGSQRAYLDVCVSNFPERVQLTETAMRSQMRVIVTEPLSNKYETIKRILNNSRSKVSILDPMKHHPLITKTKDLISEGKIGAPRILRLEAMIYDKSLADFSFFEGLVHGVSAVDSLLKDTIVRHVFAKKVKTDYSNFYVALLSFENGSTCQLVAGNSSREGKLEFSINGSTGMIAFNESKTLESPSEVKLSDTLKSIT
jgi:predicted dehydrogenase